MTAHQMTDDGESTALWAFRQPGFMGSARQLTACARCGDPLRSRATAAVRYAFAPAQHIICSACFDALPE